MSVQRHIVLAVAAHPDDIEFMMAGTLLRLKDAGAGIHMWNLANGHCGTVRHTREEIIRLRAAEAEASARLAGAVSHPPLFDDLGIFYDRVSLARVAAVVREIRPSIVLTQSPQDYMEDHQNTCRLVVTAAFSRGMCNFETEPVCGAYDTPVAVYHALPHGLKDGLGHPVASDAYVNVEPVMTRKRDMLACHTSQKEWLDVSQGMDAYLNEMDRMSAGVGLLSGRFSHAEGWRLHSTLGFGPEGFNPMKELLKGDYYGTTVK
ncbi:MAG: PIG-L family deacetylase [bacterium]